jgi:transcriptional enhancer factor
MELHHHSCVLPSNAPALPEPDHSIPSRVLQERSANTRQDYIEAPTQWKRSPSPVETVYSGRLGSYFTGNIGSQLNGEKSDQQIEFELKRLLGLLRRCEKYRKYRDRQPETKQDRDKSWPDHLEEAFFRGMLRFFLSFFQTENNTLRLDPMATNGPWKAHVGWAASWA